MVEHMFILFRSDGLNLVGSLLFYEKEDNRGKIGNSKLDTALWWLNSTLAL